MFEGEKVLISMSLVLLKLNRSEYDRHYPNKTAFNLAKQACGTSLDSMPPLIDYAQSCINYLSLL